MWREYAARARYLRTAGAELAARWDALTARLILHAWRERAHSDAAVTSAAKVVARIHASTRAAACLSEWRALTQRWTLTHLLEREMDAATLRWAFAQWRWAARRRARLHALEDEAARLHHIRLMSFCAGNWRWWAWRRRTLAVAGARLTLALRRMPFAAWRRYAIEQRAQHARNQLAAALAQRRSRELLRRCFGATPADGWRGRLAVRRVKKARVAQGAALAATFALVRQRRVLVAWHVAAVTHAQRRGRAERAQLWALERQRRRFVAAFNFWHAWAIYHAGKRARQQRADELANAALRRFAAEALAAWRLYTVARMRARYRCVHRCWSAWRDVYLPYRRAKRAYLAERVSILTANQLRRAFEGWHAHVRRSVQFRAEQLRRRTLAAVMQSCVDRLTARRAHTVFVRWRTWAAQRARTREAALRLQHHQAQRRAMAAWREYLSATSREQREGDVCVQVVHSGWVAFATHLSVRSLTPSRLVHESASHHFLRRLPPVLNVRPRSSRRAKRARLEELTHWHERHLRAAVFAQWRAVARRMGALEEARTQMADACAADTLRNTWERWRTALKSAGRLRGGLKDGWVGG